MIWFNTLIEVLKVLYAFLVPHMSINLPCHLAASWLIESLFTLFILLPLVCGCMLVLEVLVYIYIVWHQLRDRWEQWQRWMLSGPLLVHWTQMFELLLEDMLLGLLAFLPSDTCIVTGVSTCVIGESNSVFRCFMIAWRPSFWNFREFS